MYLVENDQLHQTLYHLLQFKIAAFNHNKNTIFNDNVSHITPDLPGCYIKTKGNQRYHLLLIYLPQPNPTFNNDVTQIIIGFTRLLYQNLGKLKPFSTAHSLTTSFKFLPKQSLSIIYFAKTNIHQKHLNMCNNFNCNIKKLRVISNIKM